MAVLPIRKYPDPVLRQPAQPISVIDDKLRRLAADMVETMEDASGVGLAAPQVGESIRMVVVDFDPENGDPRVLINPVITKRSGRKELSEEGCLSFPGLRTRIKRSPKVTCEAQNLDGEIVEYQPKAWPPGRSSTNSTIWTASFSSTRPARRTNCPSSRNWKSWKKTGPSCTGKAF